MARFGPGVSSLRPHPSLRAEAFDLPRHPQPIRVAWLRRGIPRHCHARASARLTRTGRPPPPCARSSASPYDPDPRSGGVCLFVSFARSRLEAEALSPLASLREVESGKWRVLSFWRCCGALRAAEGGGWRTRGRSGSSAASVVSLAGTLSAEGSGLSRPIDLRVADATTPRRTARASSPPHEAAMPTNTDEQN